MPTELQITKPDIPVKNKASNLASQRKFRATEANKIVQAFEKADLNFTALLEAIATISLTPGPPGSNAYQIAVANGFVGTQEAWLTSLVGSAGQNAYQLAVANGFVGDQSAWLASLVGAAGAPAVMTRTSNTSLAVGTGSKTFTYTSAPNLGWVYGMRLRASYLGNFMEGIVDSVSSTVVTLIVDLVGGSGTHAGWTIGVAGQQGSPDTATQIRDKINTLTGADRLAVDVLKDFVTAVFAEIQSNVSLPSPQFETISGVTHIKTLTQSADGSAVVFDRAIREIGSFDESLGSITFSLATAQKYNKCFAWIQSGSTPSWYTAAEFASGDDTVVLDISGDAFSTASDKVNLCEFVYITPLLIALNVRVFNSAVIFDPEMLFRFRFDEESVLTDSPFLSYEGLYAEEFIGEISNPGDAVWINNGGGDVGLGISRHPTTAGLRSVFKVERGINAQTIFQAGTGFTLIWDFVWRDPGAVSVDTSFLANKDATSVSGIKLYYENDGTDRIRCYINSVLKSFSYDLSYNTRYQIAFTFHNDTVLSTGTLKVYIKSTQISLPFTEIYSDASFGVQTLDIMGTYGQLTSWKVNETSSTQREYDLFYLEMWRKALSAAEVENIINSVIP
jgi:hypothetical protein